MAKLKWKEQESKVTEMMSKVKTNIKIITAIKESKKDRTVVVLEYLDVMMETSNILDAAHVIIKDSVGVPDRPEMLHDLNETREVMQYLLRVQKRTIEAT